MDNAQIFEMADRLKAAKELKKDLDAQVKAVNAEIEQLDRDLSNAMAEQELDKFTRNGSTFYLNSRLFASPAAGRTKPAAAWIEEGAALTFGDATFSQILLDAHKLHVAIKVTEELLYDNAFGLENYIITEFGKALANAEEDAFLNGDGFGKPIGLFAATGGGTVAGTLSAAIKSDDMLDLVYALKRPYRKNASFIMNDKTLAQLRKLKDNNGA